MKKVFLLVVLYCFSYYEVLLGGATSQQMQQLRKDVGTGLIDIKKVNPELEKTVYSLLDQVNTMHKLSEKNIQKTHPEGTVALQKSKETNKVSQVIRDKNPILSAHNKINA